MGMVAVFHLAEPMSLLDSHDISYDYGVGLDM